MKTNIEWYPHRKDSHRHPKFKLLRTLYGGGNSGWAMEARFWALNNLIADCEGCVLDISKTRNKAVVAEELGLSLEELDQFILRLISSDIELLYEASPGKYSTKKVSEALETALVERRKSRTRKRQVFSQQSTVGSKCEQAETQSSPTLNSFGGQGAERKGSGFAQRSNATTGSGLNPSNYPQGKDESSPELLEIPPGKINTVNNIRVKEKRIKESKGKDKAQSAKSIAHGAGNAEGRENEATKDLHHTSHFNFNFPSLTKTHKAEDVSRQYAIGSKQESKAEEDNSNLDKETHVALDCQVNEKSFAAIRLRKGEEEESYAVTGEPDFKNEAQVRERIEQMLTAYTKQKPDKATVSSFTNVVCKKNSLTRQVKSETSFKLLHKCCADFASLKKEQQNYGYLYSAFTGKINDALIRARERMGANRKKEERIQLQGNVDLEKVVERFSGHS